MVSSIVRIRNRTATTSHRNCVSSRRGVKTDFAKAVRVVSVCCHRDSWGMHRLGISTYRVMASKKRSFESVKWNRLAAAAGLKEAQTFLGFAYTHGHGAEQNYAVGNKLYHRAAEHDGRYCSATRRFGALSVSASSRIKVTYSMWLSVSASLVTCPLDLLAQIKPRLTAEVRDKVHRLADCQTAACSRTAHKFYINRTSRGAQCMFTTYRI